MLRRCRGHNLSKGNIIKIFYHSLNEITQEVLNAVTGGILLYKTPNQAYQLLKDKVLLNLDWAKNQKTKSSLKQTVAFADEGSRNSDTDKIMARMDVMTMKMDAQYKEFQSCSKQPNPDHNDDDKPILADKQSGRPSGSLPSNTQPNPKVGYKSIERGHLVVIEIMVAMDISLCSHFSDNEMMLCSLIRKKFCWGTIFPIGLKRYRDPKEEPIEKEPLMELKEIE
ncbi:hypothetical protein Tco_0214808 [Tanacetum coccineum]